MGERVIDGGYYCYTGSDTRVSPNKILLIHMHRDAWVRHGIKFRTFHLQSSVSIDAMFRTVCKILLSSTPALQ